MVLAAWESDAETLADTARRHGMRYVRLRRFVDPALEGWVVDDPTVSFGKGIERWRFVEEEAEPAAE